MKVEIHNVEAKTIHAHVEPELRDIESFLLHIRIVKIQIRLFFEEVVQVVLFAFFVPCPCRPAKDGYPVIGWYAFAEHIGFRVGPDIVFGFVSKPRVLIGGVRQDEVDDDF